MELAQVGDGGYADVMLELCARRVLASGDRNMRLFDRNFVLDRSAGTLVRAATLHHPRSSGTLNVSTTEPRLQFYDGHLLDGSITGAYGRIFDRYAALCLETQHYPDSPSRALPVRRAQAIATVSLDHQVGIHCRVTG